MMHIPNSDRAHVDEFSTRNMKALFMIEENKPLKHAYTLGLWLLY